MQWAPLDGFTLLQMPEFHGMSAANLAIYIVSAKSIFSFVQH